MEEKHKLELVLDSGIKSGLDITFVPEAKKMRLVRKAMDDMAFRFGDRPYTKETEAELCHCLGFVLQHAGFISYDIGTTWHIDLECKEDGWHWSVKNIKSGKKEEGTEEDVSACVDKIEKAVEEMRACR